MVFGLVVTLVCFVLYSWGSWMVLRYMNLTMTKYTSATNPLTTTLPVTLPIMKLLLFTSLLCSSDVVAAVSIVDFEAQPKLYSCIFGEGVFNDIVSIVLFNTVLALQSIQFSASTPFTILLQFFSLAVVSIAIGVFFGMITSLMFKHMRFLTISAVTETFILLAAGLLSYFVA